MPVETVVITGAAAGVGRATARAFGRRGARIGLLARSVDDLADAAAEIEAAGGQALVLPTDVADPDAVRWPPRRSSAGSGRSTSGSIARWARAEPTCTIAP